MTQKFLATPLVGRLLPFLCVFRYFGTRFRAFLFLGKVLVMGVRILLSDCDIVINIIYRRNIITIK